MNSAVNIHLTLQFRKIILLVSKNYINSNQYSTVPQVNTPNDQLNPFSQQGNIIKTQIISFDTQINSPVNNLALKDNSSGENNNLFAKKLRPSDDQVAHLFPNGNSIGKNGRSFNNEHIFPPFSFNLS